MIILEKVNDFNDKIRVHVELETGMGRTGVLEKFLDIFISEIDKLDNIIVEGIYTHFSSADSDTEYTNKQIDIFNRGVKLIKEKIDTIKYVHSSASNGLLNFDVETFKDERASFEEVANTYTKGVKTMAANVDFLEKKCHIQYEDISVNIMCQNYQFLYENMTNAYVREIKLYNQKITEYNSNGEGTFELYEGVKSEFIDFNNDGKYESSKDEIEKPKEETNKTTTE